MGRAVPSRTRTVRRRLRPHLLAASAAALACAFAAPAHAAGLTGAAAIPSQGTTPTSLEIGLDAQSNATAAWVDAPDGCNGTMIATRPAGGSWTTGSPLTGPQLFQTPCAYAFASNGSGAAAVAWTDLQFVSGTTYEYRVWAATRPSSGAAWVVPAAPVADVAVGSDNLQNPEVTVDPSGVVTVVWDHYVSSSGTYQVEFAKGDASGSFPSPAAAIPSAIASAPTTPQPVSDSSGAVTVLWQAQAADCASGTPCLRASRLAGGSWTTNEVAHAAAAGDSLYTPRVAAGSDGTVAAAWRYYDSAGLTSSIEVGTRKADGTWDVQTVPSSDTYDVYATQYYPAIAIDPKGGTQVVWAYDVSGTTLSYGVRAAWRPAGQLTWPDPAQDPVADLRATGAATASASEQAVSFDANGNAVAVYADGAGAAMRVRPLGSQSWDPALSLTTDAASAPVVASDALGDSEAAWIGSATAGSVVYDAGGPVVSQIALDAAPIAGLPLGMSVSAHDAWSGPVTVAWTFGDGTSGSGSAVQHVFAAAGPYPVEATATDARGNQSHAQALASVGSQPSGPGTGPGGPLPPPVEHETFNAAPVGPGGVLIQEPGSGEFVPLLSPSQVRNGAIIDVRRGRIRITIANGLGGYDTAEFYGGVFRFDQPPVKPGQRAFANLYLVGGRFRGCAAAPKSPRIASAARRKTGKKGDSRSIRQLWGSGHGNFRTVGRFSSASVRGTTWLTDDRCDGTLTRVAAGRVGVRDFLTRRTIVVTKGRTYFAGPKAH
jgi:PKD domain